MGVIKTANELFGFGLIESDEGDYLDPLSSEDEQIPPPSRRKSQKARMQVDQNATLQDAIISRRKGAKQARRVGHLRELINMVEKEDLELDFNVFEPSMSAFAELFMEREKMQAWNDFVNSTEEEQEEFLHKSVISHQTEKVDKGGDVKDSRDVEDEEGDDSWEMIPDKRAAHPSFTAEECFLRLNKDLRMMLNRRHRPMGLLTALEQDIVTFFRDSPTSVYLSKLSSGYERMILHAVCQYLDLISHSYDCEGMRHTQVENKNSTFFPPPVLLSDYLEMKSTTSNHGNMVTST